jgi:hypothetical protein
MKIRGTTSWETGALLTGPTMLSIGSLSFGPIQDTNASSSRNRIGNAVAAALSNIYHVPEDRTASRNATTFAFLILYDGLDNESKEFWPDIRRKVFHKNTP